jgi:glycosyltransferase involved in cell wall biosynthesis
MKGIAYFSKYSENGPSSRYRVYQFQKKLKEEGIESFIYPLFDDRYLELIRDASLSRNLKKVPYTISRFRKRAAALQKNKNGMLSIIEHQLFPYVPFLFERRFFPQKFLVEFDDAINLTHPYKFPKVLKSATGVIAGNRILADYARQFNSNIHMIPTVLDTNVYKPQARVKNKKIIIGWSGLEYNFRYLRILNPVFQKLHSRYPVEIVILSGVPPKDLSVPFRFEKWRGDLEASQISQFDIGLMPLEDNEWTRGKCGLKLLQYMALGIPGVASAVGVNSEIINQGENGFAVTKLEEWEEKLSLLIEDEPRRSRMGESARKTVVDRYSVDVWFPKLLEVYSLYS